MPPIEIQKTGEPTPKDERAASARVQRGGFAHGDILKNLLVTAAWTGLEVLGNHHSPLVPLNCKCNVYEGARVDP